MNTCTARLCADVDTLAKASAHFQLADTPAGYIARIEVGDITIQTFGDASVSALALALERLASDLRAKAREVTGESFRDYVRGQWAEAHPEYDRPVNHGGDCQGCGGAAVQLYDHGGAEVCAGCAFIPVEDAGRLVAALKLDVVEPNDSDRREAAHDHGLDDEAAGTGVAA